MYIIYKNKKEEKVREGVGVMNCEFTLTVLKNLSSRGSEEFPVCPQGW